jgi:hypothetical protein
MMKLSPPRIDVVKREDKEEKLISFIRTAVARADHSIPLQLTVVARSTTSPVVRALARVLADIGLRDADCRLILAMTDGGEFTAGSRSKCEFRWARQARLLDAHEQLVIDGNASWVGDCMRRDPTKRDAYECYAEQCAETSRFASMSFERLWTLSDQLAASVPSLPVVQVQAEQAVPVVPAALPAEQTDAAPVASTRH